MMASISASAEVANDVAKDIDSIRVKTVATPILPVIAKGLLIIGAVRIPSLEILT
jgi:hypothetical protein